MGQDAGAHIDSMHAVTSHHDGGRRRDEEEHRRERLRRPFAPASFGRAAPSKSDWLID
jgi:hypothetical protein